MNTNYGPQFINSGIVSSHPKSFIDKLTTSEIKRLKSLTSQLINANSEYEMNLTKAYYPLPVNLLFQFVNLWQPKKRRTKHRLFKYEITFWNIFRKRDDHKDKLIVITEYAPLGEVELIFDKTNDEWILNSQLIKKKPAIKPVF